VRESTRYRDFAHLLPRLSGLADYFCVDVSLRASERERWLRQSSNLKNANSFCEGRFLVMWIQGDCASAQPQ
jgi:hypothetical protein